LEWLFPWTWNLDEAMLSGMLGGSILGLCRLLLSLHVVSSQHPDNPRYKQVVGSHAVAMVLFASIGAAVSWAFQGRAGDFLTGVSAVVMMTLIAGKLMQSNAEAALNAPAGRSE
jgi:uncharacterized membrane protein